MHVAAVGPTQDARFVTSRSAHWAKRVTQDGPGGVRDGAHGQTDPQKAGVSPLRKAETVNRRPVMLCGTIRTKRSLGEAFHGNSGRSWAW